MRIARVFRENENDPLLMTVAETRKTIDLLEQSEEFEKWITDIRKRYNIPPNGYPLTPQTHEYDIEAVFELDVLDRFFDEAQKFCRKLNFPAYWWDSFAYFAYNNIWLTPEQTPIDIEPPNDNENTYMYSAKIRIKEKLTKTELHRLIDFWWENIEEAIAKLPRAEKHRVARAELAKKITIMKDEQKKPFKEIADLLFDEYEGTGLDNVISEDYVKLLYHRWKRRTRKISLPISTK